MHDGSRSMNMYDLLIGHFDYAEDSKGRPVTSLGRNVRRIGEQEIGEVSRFYCDFGSDRIFAEVLYVRDNITKPREVPQNEFKEYEMVSD